MMNVLQLRRWPLLAAGAALAAGLGAPSPAAAQQRGRTWDRGDDYASRIDTSFAFDRRGTVSLTLPAGDIVVTGWSQDRVRIHATSDYQNIRLDASSSRVVLELGSARGRSSDTRFEVTVPAGVRVAARSQSGDIVIRDTRGEVDASSQSGDIRVDGAASHIEVASLSGDIEGRGLDGTVGIRSVSGDIRLDDVRGDVEGESVSGSVVVSGAVSKFVRLHSTSGDVGYSGSIDPAGRYELASHSGDVRLGIPANAGALLSVSTWSGSVESDFPITLKPGAHGIGGSNAKRFTFEIGNGAGRISAESFSGDITVSKRDR